jgi:hypothetical protein
VRTWLDAFGASLHACGHIPHTSSPARAMLTASCLRSQRMKHKSFDQ